MPRKERVEVAKAELERQLNNELFAIIGKVINHRTNLIFTERLQLYKDLAEFILNREKKLVEALRDIVAIEKTRGAITDRLDMLKQVGQIAWAALDRKGG